MSVHEDTANDEGRMYSEAEVTEKLAEIQLDLKSQLASFRKPPPYSEAKDPGLYLKDFNSYRQVVSLPKRIIYQTFVSYLPDNLKWRL